MSVAPNLPPPGPNQGLFQPRLYGLLNSVFVPTETADLTQTSYGIADTLEITTPLASAQTDYGQLSQTVQPCPYQINGGYMSAVQPMTAQPFMNGILEELDNDYTEDVITIHGRGILANLVDARINLKVHMNETVTQVITQLITSYGLKAQVAPSSALVGNILKTDYVALGRNVRALDFIHMLCRYVGWATRAVGNTVVVGPPPDATAPTINMSFPNSSVLSLRIRHNALHSHTVKVKVVSYVQSTKARGLAGPQGPLAAFLGLPVPVSKTGTVSRSGNISGTSSVGERDNIEEYVIPLPNLSQADCLRMAQVLQDEIATHEFIMMLQFVPTAAQLKMMLAVSPEFNIYLSGCDQASNNGLYYPKSVNWKWSEGKDGKSAGGLVVSIEALNHPLPAPSGSLPNASLSDVP